MELQNHSGATDIVKDEAGPLASSDPSLERSETRSALRQHVPRVDILEGPDALRLDFDLPGVLDEDVDLRVERGDLSLTAEDPLRGRVYRRAFSLPDTLDPEAVDAELAAGVLTVRLGKRSEAKPRRIAIRSAD